MRRSQKNQSPKKGNICAQSAFKGVFFCQGLVGKISVFKQKVSSLRYVWGSLVIALSLLVINACDIFNQSSSEVLSIKFTSLQKYNSDSMEIALFSVSDDQLLKVLHQGSYNMANPFQINLPNNLPDSFALNIKGFDNKKMLLYHQRRIFRKGAFSQIEFWFSGLKSAVFEIGKSSTANVSLKSCPDTLLGPNPAPGAFKDTLLVSQVPNWSLSSQRQTRSIYWLLNDSIFTHTYKVADPLNKTVIRNNHGSILRVLTEHEDGYSLTHPCRIYVAQGFTTSSRIEGPYPVRNDIVYISAPFLSWAPIYSEKNGESGIEKVAWSYTVMLGLDSTQMDTLATAVRADYTTSIPLQVNKPGEKYFWKVLARDLLSKSPSDVYGDSLKTSPIWEFTLSANPLNANAPLQPEKSSLTILPDSVELRWTGGDPDLSSTSQKQQKLRYSVFLSKSNPPDIQPYRTLKSNLQESTSLTVKKLEANTRYYWRVYASDGMATTPGAIWFFDTPAN